ncbi:unnamed protein product [Symbiodinium necroappetens]|uniref:Uncharacterized protein n=1 Tax=Symbiodinium necroappetens TaxID=1628268 RepID=A0A812N3V7_9DINO|nr:unnamed protein product [Symbiodinium necroappetens]
MRGLLLAESQGSDVQAAADSFWVPLLCQRGMLIRVQSKFYLSLGPTPAVLPLEEIELSFRGTLPLEDVDEKLVRRENDRPDLLGDCLLDGECVKALVQCHRYTIHTCGGALAQKLSCCCLLRRSAKPFPLVAVLMQRADIFKLTSDCLSRVLTAYNVRFRKNGTKTSKIREIAKLGIVEQHVSKKSIEKVLKMCEELDERRRKKASSSNEDDPDADEEDDDADEAKLKLYKSRG